MNITLENGTTFTGYNLDAFTLAYIEALFFTDGGPDNEEFEGKGISDFSTAAMDQIVKDCAEFQALPIMQHFNESEATATVTQAGHDFWLTRNGHGAGFWDRPEIYGSKARADELTAAAKAAGNCETYIGDDGKIYFD